MKKILFTSIIFLILFCTTTAQINAPFITGSFGAYSNGSGNRLQERNSPSFVFSTGFGLPLFGDISLYTRLSYISRSNYIANEYNSFLNSELNPINELVQANASFSQLLFNGGLQYNINLYEDVTLGFSGGLTYAIVNHKAALANGTVVQRINDVGVFGAFTGVSLEKSFEDSNTAVYGEAQYNYAKKNMIYFRDKFSGMNFTFGGRFYLN